MDVDELAIKVKEYKLEKWKVLLSILTPLVLVALTFVVNNAIQERGAKLKKDEQILSEKQRIYSELGRRLNIIFVYIADVGDFRSYSPPQIVELKREVDRQFFMYRPYWSKGTERNYDQFMTAAFRTYTGAGLPAQINASKSQKVSAYKVDKLKWEPGWDAYFTENIDRNVSTKYNDLVSSLLTDTVNADIRKGAP